MADRAITDLNAATVMNNNDLFVISQGGQAKKVSWETFYQYLSETMWAHGGIDDVTYTAPASGSLNGTMVITFGDNTTSSFTITNGRGISSISKISTSGLVDTYRISYNNNTTSTFTVTNGRGVSSFTKSTSGLTDTYTITYTDGTTSEMEVTNGRGITDITWTESGTTGDGKIHTGTISYNDGTTSAVSFTDGVKGDTGPAWYMHIKYSHVEPSSDSDMKSTPDDWIGIYSGTSTTPPTDYTAYTWYQYKGETGDTGTSITGVTKTGSSGATDTYTISFSDGTSTTFDVTNGSDIESITKTATSGLLDTYTVELTDGTTTTFDVTNGKGIASITQTGGSHAAGTSDTYTITFNDNDTFSFQVYNGANGTGAVSTVAGIGVSSADGDVPLILKGNAPPTQNTVGQENQLYYDLSGGVMYICLGESGGLYNWVGTGVRIDDALSASSTRPVQNAVITQKVGTATLNTTAQDLSGAINEHESEISNKVDKVTGKGLSTNDYSNAEKNKVADAGTNIENLQTKVGAAALDTTNKDLSGAVNELKQNTDGKVFKSGDTITGLLTMFGGVQQNIELKSSTVERASNPSANSYPPAIRYMDKSDHTLAFLQYTKQVNGRMLLTTIVNSTNGTQHYLYQGWDQNGNAEIATSHPNAWRKALGLGTDGAFPITFAQGGTGQTGTSIVNTVSNIATATSRFKINSASYAQWGKVAQINITFECTTAVTSASGGVGLGTMVAGKRPAIMGTITDSGGNHITFNANGDLVAWRTFAVGDTVSVRGTYILA